MSAPRTNIATQQRRHRAALLGISAVLIFVGLLFTYWLLYVAADASDQPPDAQAPATQQPTAGPTPDGATQP